MKEQANLLVTDVWTALPVGTIHFTNTSRGVVRHKLSSITPDLTEIGIPVFQYDSVVFTVNDTCWVKSDDTAKDIVYTTDV